MSTLREWLAAHPPAEGRFTASVAGVARRVRAGEELLPAVRELLDEWALAPSDVVRARLLSPPAPVTGDARADAYLGALAEHLAVTGGLPAPPWSRTPERFLPSFWFVSEVRGFRPLALAQSPAAFRRRNIFISRDSLHRV